MASLMSKLRPTKTKSLSADEHVNNESKKTEELQPGLHQCLEVLQLLYADSENGVPDELPESLTGHPKPVSDGGLTILPWNLFMKDPRRLEELLQVRGDNHISYDSSHVNALFQATYMDSPSFGEISTQTDSWIICTESARELETLRDRMCSRVSILGLSIARYTGKWRTAESVPCLLMMDPENKQFHEVITSGINQAILSLQDGKHFSVEVDLNLCVEEWCEVTLGTRCRSNGAKIVITSGEPYQPVVSRERLLCCVLCLPLWGIQTCMYQIQRKSVYNDVIICPNITVRLHNSAWVRRERQTTKNSDTTSASPNETNVINNESSYTAETQHNDDDENQSKKNRKRNRREKTRSARSTSHLTGEDNTGFVAESFHNSSTLASSPSEHDTSPDSSSGVVKDNRPIMKDKVRVLTGEMLLTESVELVRFAKLGDQKLISSLEKHRENTDGRRTDPVFVEKDMDSKNGSSRDDCKRVFRGVGASSSNDHRVGAAHVQSKFLRSGSQVCLSPDSGSTSSTAHTSSPSHSSSSSVMSKDKQTKLFTKPKSILKEIRRTTDDVAKLSGNGVDEFQRSKAPLERSNSAIPSTRRSVRFNEDKVVPISRKLSRRRSGTQSRNQNVADQSEDQHSKRPVRVGEFNEKISMNNIKDVGVNQNTGELRDKSPIPVADGMLTNAWSFSQSSKTEPVKREASPCNPQPVANPKSFLRPKAKVVFSTDDEESDVDWRSSSSRVIMVNGSGTVDMFDTTDLDKDTETDTEVSKFRLEDVESEEVNYLSDSHISVPSLKNSTKKPYQKSRVRRQTSNPRKYQGTSLPRKRLYNPKKQSLSMLSLNGL